MSWFLIYLVLQKTKSFPNKVISYYLILFLVTCSFLSLFFIFFPTQSEIPNRVQFFRSLFYLEFLFKFYEDRLNSIYYPSLTAFFLLSFLFLSFFKQKNEFTYKLFGILILCFAFCSAILPFSNLTPFLKLTTEEEVRVFISCISHPICILFWWLFEKKNLKSIPPFFQFV